MRILLDENLDWRLARSLAGHEVAAAHANIRVHWRPFAVFK